MKNASDVSDRSRLFRLLMIGDVVGKPGKSILTEHLPRIREERLVDFVVINAENAKDGSGITPEIYNTLIECGVDCITLGDHAFRSKSIYPMLNDPTSRLVRPANFPAEAPGRGYALIESVGANGRPATLVGVTSLLGRVFMQNPIDNPFSTRLVMLVNSSRVDRSVQTLRETQTNHRVFTSSAIEQKSRKLVNSENVARTSGRFLFLAQQYFDPTQNQEQATEHEKTNPANNQEKHRIVEPRRRRFVD